MSEFVSGPGKTARQSSQSLSTRRLWRDPVRPSATPSGPVGTQAADFSSVPVHAPERASRVDASVGLHASGSPFDGAIVQEMEPQFGDLRGVHVHTDAQAAASANRLGAAAYTYKNHVVFGAGRYAPHTRTGRDLLAHELVHVVQQRGVSSGESSEIADRDHPLERNARSVLAGKAAPANASRAMVMRQGVDDPLPPVSLSKPADRLGSKPKERPSIMSGHLGFHLLESDKQTLSEFLRSGNLEVGPGLTPAFQGQPMSLDEVTDLARKLVLPIVPREEVAQFVTGRFLTTLRTVRELPAPAPMQFLLPSDDDMLADKGGGGKSSGSSDWQAAVGGQWTYHMDRHSDPKTSDSVQVQFQHGSGAVVEIFQYQVDLKTRVAQPMAGVQFQYSKTRKVLGVVLQGTAFVQLMAGLTQAPGSLSGDVTFQVQGGVQGTATFGKVSVALQVGISLTLQDRQKPAWDTNIAPQAGGPDTFGMINAPGGGQVAGLTLRF
jgi:hypothetical protein